VEADSAPLPAGLTPQRGKRAFVEMPASDGPRPKAGVLGFGHDIELGAFDRRVM
jgi:hypothetical protein